MTILKTIKKTGMKMQAKWTNNKGNVEVSFDAKTETDLVKKIALLEKLQPSMSDVEDVDLFAALANSYNNDVLNEEVCGKCKSKETYCVIRTDKDENKYHEMKCKDCYAKLPFGVNKVGGGLYAKRRDSEGGIRGSNGWVVYNPKTKKEE
jgi:hypothetical protein